MYFPIIFHVPIPWTSTGLTVFWPVERVSRCKHSPSSFTWNHEFQTRMPICLFLESRVSSSHRNEVPLTFQKSKYHFTVSSVESHKSIKRTLHVWVPCITLIVVLQKMMVAWGSQRRHASQVMARGGLSLECPPPPTATLQYFLVALFKSKKKTTCWFLKSRVCLRKPQVGM